MSENSYKTFGLNVAGWKKDPATGYIKSIDVKDGNGDIYTVSDESNAQNTKTVKVDFNGQIAILPDTPYTSMEQVNLEVNVPVGKTLYAWKHSSDIIYTKTLPKKSATIQIVKLPLADDTGTYTEAQPEKVVSIWKDGVNFIDNKGKAATEPSGTAGTPVDVGDYVTDSTDYFKKADTPHEVVYNIWKIGSSFYNQDLSAGTEPAGTAGTPTKVGDVYQAVSTDTHLTEDAWYVKIGTDYFPFVSLTTSDINVGPQIEDADMLTDLAAATFVEVDAVAYTADVYDYFKVLNFGTSEATTTKSVDAETDPAIIAILDADTPTEIDYVPYTIAAVDEVLTFDSDDYERYSNGDYEV